MELVKNHPKLKSALERKILDYSTMYYAPRLRTNHEDPDRIKKFDKISKIIRSLDQDLVKSYNGYTRRLLKALSSGNIGRAEKVVTRYWNWKEFRKVTKNKRSFYIFLYRQFFLKAPLKQNYVLCESFFGKNYSNNPKYIYEYLAGNYPGRYRFIWVIQDKKTNIPYPHIKIKRYGLRYAYYLARSKYYIFNGRQPDWVIKRKGNIFLQTWHGTPLKRLVFDLEDINAATVRYKNTTYRQSLAWDYLIAANQYSSNIFRRCFKYEKNMLETGYPRNDILHAQNKDVLMAKVKEKLGLPEDKKIILYAPTWRDDEYYTKGRYKFSLELDLALLKERLGNEYAILLRTHYFIADTIDITGYEDFAFDVSKYDDISELYLISDILITDYSSVFFDYANLKRPMLFFTYDLEKYRDLLRGFYIDIEEELPGPLLFTTEEIITAVQNIDQLQLEYQEKQDAFYHKYCAWEDGQASKRVAEAVFRPKGDKK
jgi:CDP-glycerol glycerophosphotransferase